MKIFQNTKQDIDTIKNFPIIGEQPKSDKEEEFLREVCEYEFSNLEEPGVMNQSMYGNTKQNTVFKFFHGGRYKLPRFIARHYDSCSTPEYAYKPDGSGHIGKQQSGRKHRFQMRQVFTQNA